MVKTKKANINRKFKHSRNRRNRSRHNRSKYNRSRHNRSRHNRSRRNRSKRNYIKRGGNNISQKEIDRLVNKEYKNLLEEAFVHRSNTRIEPLFNNRNMQGTSAEGEERDKLLAKAKKNVKLRLGLEFEPYYKEDTEERAILNQLIEEEEQRARKEAEEQAKKNKKNKIINRIENNANDVLNKNSSVGSDIKNRVEKYYENRSYV